MGNRIKVLAIVVAVVAMVGCTASRPAPVRPVAQVVTTAADCSAPDVAAQLLGGRGGSAAPTASAIPVAGTVPPGFAPVSAVECTLSTDARTLVERRLSGDLTALVTAVDEPSARVPVDGACPAMAQIQPVLFLVDASGRTVRVAWPLDECGFVKPTALAAMAALHVDDERAVTTA